MDISRRTFLGGAMAAAVVPCGAGEVEKRAAAVDERTKFPYLLLELHGKYPGEEGPQEVTHLAARRMVSVDLEDEEDWGDLNSFWDGAEMAWGLGNDIDGYWKIERVFEMIEPREDLHEDKFPVAYELSFEDLSDLMEARIASWCD